jgi:hypothetical protein
MLILNESWFGFSMANQFKQFTVEKEVFEMRGVGTLKIRMLKDQNVESFFMDDQNVKSQKIRTSKITLSKIASSKRMSKVREIRLSTF